MLLYNTPQMMFFLLGKGRRGKQGEVIGERGRVLLSPIPSPLFARLFASLPDRFERLEQTIVNTQTCCRYSPIWSLIGLFPYFVASTCPTNSTHEASPLQFKPIWIRGTSRGDKILSPQQVVLLKTGISPEGTCCRDLSPRVCRP